MLQLAPVRCREVGLFVDPIQRTSPALTGVWRQQELDVSKELTFTTGCRGKSLNRRPFGFLGERSTAELTCFSLQKM